MERETLETLIARDLSTRQIADELGCSRSTVSAWLRRHGLRTSEAARRRRARLERSTARCEVHGETPHVVDRQGTTRCLACRSAAVVRRRRLAKLQLVAESGGACIACGYDAIPAALHFHHLDPDAKSFGIAHGGMSRSMAALRAEATKCVLVCANCHAGVEAGVLQLPTAPRSGFEPLRTD